MQQALLSVNEKDREALTLYYADGLSYSEICGFLGISHGHAQGPPPARPGGPAKGTGHG